MNMLNVYFIQDATYIKWPSQHYTRGHELNQAGRRWAFEVKKYKLYISYSCLVMNMMQGNNSLHDEA